MRNGIFFFVVTLLLFTSCQDDVLPKPRAFLALDYPSPEYAELATSCPYSFEMNRLARVVPAKAAHPCWINLEYPLLNAAIFLTYQKVQGNLDSLLLDAQRLPLQHTVKADFIEGDVYTNQENDTHGMLYKIEGDAASQAQFYITDSTSHFMTGVLYFNQKPNYDSIMPAAVYLERDIKHLMESLRWNE